MRQRAGLLLCTAVVLAMRPSSAQALEREGDNDELIELLRDDTLDEETHTENLSWVHRRLLRQGPAYTPELGVQVEHLMRRGLQRPSLTERIEREADLARLRPRHREDEQGIAFDIPVADHPLVDVYIDYFTGRGRWFFQRWLSRADRYLPLMQPILEETGLPKDTVYLAMIESGFVSKAYSVAAASGFWQFIASTGKLYKLQQDAWVDERRDFVRATKAAAAYLTDLHDEFGDWHLAWAGYNAGGGRIRRALARTGAKDFWSLIDHDQALAKETRHYVPKIIAAAVVAKNRAAYGFTEIEPEPPLKFDEVPVTDAVALSRIAENFKVSMDELVDLNPGLLFGVSPPGRNFTVRVPAGLGPQVSEWLHNLPREQRVSFRQYVVRTGDTLWRIAERLGSTIDAIREFNGIRNAKALKIGQRLIVPGIKSQTPHVARGITGPKPRSASVAAPAPSGKTPVARHVVGPGETLWSISQRYNVTVQNIKTWNHRSSNRIGVGEVLNIF